MADGRLKLRRIVLRTTNARQVGRGDSFIWIGGGEEMNRRDKIAIRFNQHGLEPRYGLIDDILHYVDNEPSGLVKVRNCLWHLNHGLQACVKGMDCPDCHGAGSIRTPMTQKEVVEQFKLLCESIKPNRMTLPSGERVEVEG